MIIRTFLIALLCLCSACTACGGKSKETARMNDTAEQEEGKQDHVCEIRAYPLSDNDILFSSLYEVPAHCFEPHVTDPDIAIENQNRKKFLNIIEVMEARPQHETGAQMLDFCWEKDWKWDHLPEDQGPNSFPLICAVSQLVTKEDVETVKKIELCRLECLGVDPYLE